MWHELLKSSKKKKKKKGCPKPFQSRNSFFKFSLHSRDYEFYSTTTPSIAQTLAHHVCLNTGKAYEFYAADL
jgi:hypothetical protein